MGDNGDVRGGVSDAGEHPPFNHLFVLEEAAVGLVDGAADHLAGAGGAGSGTARVRQL